MIWIKRHKYVVGMLSALLLYFCFFVYTESQNVRTFPPTAWDKDHMADCAIVLTGGLGRIREGFDLLVQGAVQKLIISGVNPQARLNELFPQWPYYGKINEKDVILERRSTTTFGNAQQSLPIVEALHCRDIVLITSHLHMKRALRTFRAVFPDRFPIYPRAIVGGAFRPHFDEWAAEVLKSVFYSLWVY